MIKKWLPDQGICLIKDFYNKTMETILFIKPEDVIRNSILDGNVDRNKFLPYIKIAQETHVHNFLGKNLYDAFVKGIRDDTLTNRYKLLLSEYIQPMVIHFSMVVYLPFASYAIKNGGIQKHVGDTSESLEKHEINALVEQERRFAQSYTDKFVDFMCDNSNDFPEYNTSNTKDGNPSKEVYFAGIQTYRNEHITQDEYYFNNKNR